MKSAFIAAGSAALATAATFGVMTIAPGSDAGAQSTPSTPAALAKEQKAINKRLKAAILRANAANKRSRANQGAIAGIPGTAGAQGPQGAEGAPGAGGAPGAIGPPGISGHQLVAGTAISVPAAGEATAQVSCPGDKRVLGGGIVSGFGASDTNITVVESFPVTTRRWAVTVKNSGGVSRNVIASAVCADVNS